MEKTDLPLISVNILSWNRKPDLAFILTQIKQANYPPDKLEVIVVDNASADGAPEMVEKDFPEVKLIRRKINNGIGGWNDGFAIARGEYIIVLDDDAYPAPDAYYNIVKFFGQNQRCGILAMGMIHGFNSESAPICFKCAWDDTVALGFSGGTAVIRKKVIEEVDGYDEHLFLGAHELDFAIRVLDGGFEIKHTHKIMCFHKVAGGYRRDGRYIYYNTRNKLWVTWKYFPLYAILISNIIWIAHSFILSITTNTFKGFLRSLTDAFKGMSYLRKSYPRYHLVNPAVTKRLLRRFSYKTFILGIKDIKIIRSAFVKASKLIL